MRLGSISDEEIYVAKKGLINSLRQMPDSSASLVVAGFKQRLMTGKTTSVNQRIQAIESISKHDIIAFAQKVKVCSVFFLTSNGETDIIDSEEYDDE